jgi:hypothetical protein
VGQLRVSLWYAQAYDDYDIWAVNVEGLQLLPDKGFGEFADGVDHACFSRQPIAAEQLRGIEASYGGETPEQLTRVPRAEPGSPRWELLRPAERQDLLERLDQTGEIHARFTSSPGCVGAWAKGAKRGSGVKSARSACSISGSEGVVLIAIWPGIRS